MIDKLTAQQVRRRCDPADLPFATTSDLPPADAVLGQERAVRALDFGLRIAAPGYHVFAVGPNGVGRRTAIERAAAAVVSDRPQAPDWAYVHNFADARAPIALALRSGSARRLRDELEQLIADASERLRAAFEADEYDEARDAIQRRRVELDDARFSQIAANIQPYGLHIVRTATGLDIAQSDPSASLTDAARAAWNASREQLDDALRAARRAAKEVKSALDALDGEVARSVVRLLVDDVRAAAPELCTSHQRPALDAWLDALQNDLVAHHAVFLAADDQTTPTENALFLNRYRVNVFVDHARSSPGAPLIFEDNPTLRTLIGRIERTVTLSNQAPVVSGAADHMMLRPGALHRANGGILVLDARALLDAGDALPALLRCLRRASIRIDEPGDAQFLGQPTLEPQPIPLDVKIVLDGSGAAFWECGASTEGFSQQFKVKAEFVTQMQRTASNELAYGAFLAGLSLAEGLAPFDRAAVAWLVEHGSRMVDDQEKLSTRFSVLADVAREASYWARTAGRGVVTRDDVRNAHAERRARVARYEDDTREFILRGVYHVATSGEEVGQVNGLSVINLGDHEFGKPARITARSYVTRGGINDVDRSVAYTDPSHNKGIALIDSYLTGVYSAEQSLTIAANVTFEQSLTHHEGDSASCAILLTLLSAVSNQPIPQSLAVSGTLDQFGAVRPVGAVTTKVEGFYDLCAARGLDGLHGVVLPRSNAVDLMLREEIVEAIEQGRFHVFTVEHVDDLIELFFGMPAGQREANGQFTEGSVHALVESALRAINDKLDGRRRNGAPPAPASAAPEPPPAEPEPGPPPQPIDPNPAPPPVVPEPEPEDPALG